jgi:hypothetical protein
MSYAATSAAHSRYVLPSHTLLSGEETQKVTLSASISNDIFHPDMPFGADDTSHVPMPLKALFKQLKSSVTDPDGEVVPLGWQAYARNSVADVMLPKSGTYRISVIQPPLPMTTFTLSNGDDGRVFGDGVLPENISNVVKRNVSARVETYVTHNKVNKTALLSSGSGLELAGDSHPNDLFVNEDNSFQLLFDGKGVENVDISLTKAGTKHRNKRNEAHVITQKDGYFTVLVEEAGFYLLEAEYTLKGDSGSEVDFHHHSLYVTLEVFPE